MGIRSKEWWKAAGKRALRTFIQTLVASVASIGFIGNDLGAILLNSLITSIIAGLTSLLMSIEGLPELQDNTGDEPPEKGE